MIDFLLAIILSFRGTSSFVMPGHVQTVRRYPLKSKFQVSITRNCMSTVNRLALNDNIHSGEKHFTWSPQDLTKDCTGFLPIPDDDYLKKYQENPELWPVEFFLVVYRRTKNKESRKSETQILVRESANGTSKWGVGTGVPATRWMLSAQEGPPLGYKWSSPPLSMKDPVSTQHPRISFEASNFPEWGGQNSWAYTKIDIREDAFNGPDSKEFKDSELENYANRIRNNLRTKFSEKIGDGNNRNSWESNRLSVVKHVVEKSNSLAAIQGTLRMSGLFARRKACDIQQKNDIAAEDESACPRYVDLGKNAPDPAKLVRSMRVFTMFPQMPDPMPQPSTSPEELQQEITSRASRMAKKGRDPHKDKYGRIFTHISTSNVSNTIHGVYFTLDATDLPGLDDVPALDLFGTEHVKRQWKSLEDLKVLDSDGTSISKEDTKPTFISGFIVRQLVKDAVIDIKE
uniref:Uncharacterized protein n=1 Tax=Odontella aurita TaxID=265563 RepID=A0A7S4MTZ9_9STRA|mmetsp:Transcript_32608/g.97420  ORF Transcript_32608/g.97420 Transcript_32608/m.97420 type:complete len:458 (+) Transcript_32608:162-1535(+)|eukprot:CAMPEP_0113582202 /NCGR_PEP_ID=MMETSP0015_2-20120614/31763_1 /TAXON_ID=2838 /ORGANISM="Odontella" /LENGTH=457 /DNA_ID=CAMNT_0000486807 /DNA_START=156 /DNA_END=1529 /DNA_ORIENTATION=+ /assembly_acc=CAM_ASM_000160